MAQRVTEFYSLIGGVRTAMMMPMVTKPRIGPRYPPKSPSFASRIAASFIFTATSWATGAASDMLYIT